MGNAYTARLVPERNRFVTESLADGNYDFPVDERLPNPNNLIDYLYCVDAVGDPLPATAGTFTLYGSADGGKTWGELQDHVVSAADALSPSLLRPSGRGTLTVLRVVAAGLVSAGATGFAVSLTQHV